MIDIAHIRTKYKDRMLQTAFIVSGWSQEPEGQRHGCVLAIKGKYLVSTGFNGPDRYWDAAVGLGQLGCGDACCKAPVVHAEINALLNLRDVLGSYVFNMSLVAYVTKKPCDPCMKALKDARIEAILWLQDVGEDRGQWIL